MGAGTHVNIAVWLGQAKLLEEDSRQFVVVVLSRMNKDAFDGLRRMAVVPLQSLPERAVLDELRPGTNYVDNFHSILSRPLL